MAPRRDARYRRPMPPNRDREEPRGSSPPTPPYIRITYTAVRRIEGKGSVLDQARPSQGGEGPPRARHHQSRALAQAPWTVGRRDRVPGQDDAHAPRPELAVATATPLRPVGAPQSTTDPLVEVRQRRGDLGEPKVRSPARRACTRPDDGQAGRSYRSGLFVARLRAAVPVMRARRPRASRGRCDDATLPPRDSGPGRRSRSDPFQPGEDLSGKPVAVLPGHLPQQSILPALDLID